MGSTCLARNLYESNFPSISLSFCPSAFSTQTLWTSEPLTTKSQALSGFLVCGFGAGKYIVTSSQIAFASAVISLIDSARWLRDFDQASAIGLAASLRGFCPSKGFLRICCWLVTAAEAAPNKTV